jgi:hypothetical protein
MQDHLNGLALINPLNGDSAKTEPVDFESGFSEYTTFHKIVLPLMNCVPVNHLLGHGVEACGSVEEELWGNLLPVSTRNQPRDVCFSFHCFFHENLTDP